MKFIDKFLKKLNTNRNTFATYVLTLVSVYLVVDRIVEMLLMIFTGVAVSYWNPIQYTLALACPVFAYLFAPSSSFATSKNHKITLFYVYVIGLYIIAISMFTQWLNRGCWLLLISIPNYIELVTDFSYLIKPAISSISIYLPLVTFYSVIKFLYLGVNDTKDEKRSIWDFKGIDLSDKKKGHGPYTNDIFMFTDKETGAKITFFEEHRYQSLFVCGGSGTGKTSLVFEPMIAKDLERKFFYSEVSKELGFTALKTGIANLNCPYDNDYLNDNFSLNMITPTDGKASLFKSYMKKMILSSSPLVYKDVGVTYVSPDFETLSHMIDVCNNFKIKYKLVDPSNLESFGINPFIYDDPNKIAVTISSVLKGMYTDTFAERGEAIQTYREETTIQAIENLSLLLKEMYPRMNEGALPNLEDMLKMLTNFDLVEKMCKVMETDTELAEKYSTQLSYFKKNFYKTGKGREETEKYIYTAITQLDNLLRLPGVKNVLCNRYKNIDFDNILSNGDVTFVCTRRGDLGASSSKAFGLFFLLTMQNAVLRRPGNENSRVPNFLYIDEFPDFLCKSTEAIFTLYRKYRVGTVISAQNLSQLEAPMGKINYRSTILSNCASKIFTGNGEYDELVWWSNEFGKRRDWKYTRDMDGNKLEYKDDYKSVKYDWADFFSVGKLQTLSFKKCAFKIKDSGKSLVGEGCLYFLESKYKEPKNVKKYNFTKFTPGVATKIDTSDDPKPKFDIKNLNFVDERNEINPIQTDTTDADFLFNNDDAIVFNMKKKKEN